MSRDYDKSAVLTSAIGMAIRFGALDLALLLKESLAEEQDRIRKQAIRERIEDSGLFVYCGYQPDCKGDGFHLYNLTKDVPGHPKHSTLAETTALKVLEGDDES